MLLTLDIGNSGVSAGVFDKGTLLYKASIKSCLTEKEYVKFFYDIAKDYAVTDCIISSVVKELNDIILESVRNSFKTEPVMLTAEKLNEIIPNITKEPNLTGTDRLVNVYAAKRMYKIPAIVVDLGTATTFDIINSEGKFTGGLIMPGINLQLSSLYSKTSLLPEIKPDYADKVIGDDTKTSILSGVIRGHAYAIKGLLKQSECEMKERPFVILTGGLSELISEYLKEDYNVLNKDLTLYGLKYLKEEV